MVGFLARDTPKISPRDGKPNVKAADFEKLAQTTDPLLAVVVVRIANSEYFGFDRKVHPLLGRSKGSVT
jgi:HD-like signal output (HDOD) protein